MDLFIKVSEIGAKTDTFINVSNILHFEDVGKGAVIHMSDGTTLNLAQNSEIVISAINDAKKSALIIINAFKNA